MADDAVGAGCRERVDALGDLCPQVGAGGVQGMVRSGPEPAMLTLIRPVGAENAVTSCDLQVFVDQSLNDQDWGEAAAVSAAARKQIAVARLVQPGRPRRATSRGLIAGSRRRDHLIT